jgi:hypothetical protein
MRLPTRFLALSLALSFGSSAAAAAEDGPVLEVRIVTKTGGRFTGLVPKSAPIADRFAPGDTIDVTKLPRSGVIKLDGVNGLPGSMTVKVPELASIEILGQVDAEAADESSKRIRLAKAEMWEKERVRLAKVAEDRAARSRSEAEAEAAAAAEAEKIPTLDPEHQAWIDLYPPAEGWLPVKKQELYHQTVILNNRFPTEQERAWLDSYDSWKVAYDAWYAIEQLKIAAEEKAKAEGLAPPTGADRPDPSNTASQAGAAVDPEAPSPEDAAKLPPKIKDSVATPVKIGADVPPPAKLDPDVEKPAKLPNGTDPGR